MVSERRATGSHRTISKKATTTGGWHNPKLGGVVWKQWARVGVMALLARAGGPGDGCQRKKEGPEYFGAWWWM